MIAERLLLLSCADKFLLLFVVQYCGRCHFTQNFASILSKLYNSFFDSNRDIYSASVLDITTVRCLRRSQLTAALPCVYPVKDLLSSMFAPRSARHSPLNALLRLKVKPKCSMLSRNTCFAAT